jgi:hypothetical protein
MLMTLPIVEIDATIVLAPEDASYAWRFVLLRHVSGYDFASPVM